MRRLAAFLSTALAAGAAAAAPTADLVLIHGKVVTLEAQLPTAAALAVKDGRILALGSEADIKPYIGKATQVVDMQGGTAVPGFIEGHGHFLELGDSLMQLDLTQAKDWDAIVAM